MAQTFGTEGDVSVTARYGRFYRQSKLGRLFMASTAIAGTVIPVNASNLVSTFTLANPLASGVNLSLLRYRLGLAGTTTAVIGNISLAHQTPYTAFTTTTLGGLVNTQLGGLAPNAICYTAATFTGTPTLIGTLGLSFGTTAAGAGPSNAVCDLDGEITVPPGGAVTIVGNAAQTQPMAQSLLFAEIPTGEKTTSG